MSTRVLLAATLSTGLIGWLPSPTAPEPVQQVERGDAVEPPHNVLLVIADDLSASDLAIYAINPDAPSGLTPNIDRLAARGMLFENAWANPLCSPTRALLMTGRHAFRTGIGSIIERGTVSLAESETTLPEALRSHAGRPYATAAFGKWHLQSPADTVTCPPTALHGFDTFAGTLFGLTEGYCDWPLLACPGGEVNDPGYMLSTLTERASDWIRAQSGPWFAYFAPQSPYDILHVPPADLQTRVSGPPCSPCNGWERRCFKAAVQAFDTELGELVSALGPDWESHTTILLTGDNGSPNNSLDYWPPKHGKGTLFEGGLHVPLIISGRGVAQALRGTRSSELVGLADVFRTVTGLAGIGDLPSEVAEDSIDLGPLLRGEPGARGRAVLMAEKFRPNAPAPPFTNHRMALREERFKLIHSVSRNAPLALFDLENDPRELNDLLGSPPDPSALRGTPAGAALERLTAALPLGALGRAPRSPGGPRSRRAWLLALAALVAGGLWLATRRRRRGPSAAA